MVQRIMPLPPVRIPGVGVIDMSITNSVLFMLIAAALISTFFLVSARRALVPGRMQALAEMLYGMVDGALTGGIIGDRGRAFPALRLHPLPADRHPGHHRPGAGRLHRHLAAGGHRGPGGDDLRHRPGGRLRAQRPGLLQAVLAVGRPLGHGPLPDAHRADLVLGAPPDPGHATVRQHAGRPRGDLYVRQLRHRPGPVRPAGRPGQAWASSARRCPS